MSAEDAASVITDNMETFGKFVTIVTDDIETTLFSVITFMTREAMRQAGEDADNSALVATRVQQVIYGLNSKAERALREVFRHGS